MKCDFSKLTKILFSLDNNDKVISDETIDENSLKNKKGKKIEIKDIQVGDTIRFNNQEYVIIDYMSHNSTFKNKMKEPNIIIFNAFNCDTENTEELSLDVDNDKVESLKNDKDLYIVEFVKPTIVNASKIMQPGRTFILAEKKKEVEEKINESDSKIQILKIEKLIHVKVKREK